MPRHPMDGRRSPLPRRLRLDAAAVLALAAALLAIGPSSRGRAQVAEQAGADWTIGAPVDTSGLGSGPYAEMQMLYERTLFRVDVLRLSLRFNAETAAELERLAAGNAYERRFDASVSAAALAARDVLVCSRFLRDISLDQFLDGIRDNLRSARRAGILTAAEQTEIEAGVATSYAPLVGRPIRAGEKIWYRVRDDELHMVFQALDGSIALDLRFEGSQHRRAVLGGYLAPDSDFRAGLIRSLFQ